jgi:hypothetical protein
MPPGYSKANIRLSLPTAFVPVARGTLRSLAALAKQRERSNSQSPKAGRTEAQQDRARVTGAQNYEIQKEHRSKAGVKGDQEDRRLTSAEWRTD